MKGNDEKEIRKKRKTEKEKQKKKKELEEEEERREPCYNHCQWRGNVCI